MKTASVHEARTRARTIVALVVALAGLGAPADAATGEDLATSGRVCASYVTGDTGIGFTSQNFEPEFDAYDDVGADHFEVSRRCRARAVTVIGTYFAGIGPARSETVAFYRDRGGMPGKVISSETVVGEDTAGSFDIVLDRAVRLRPGRTYWFSAQVNMDFSCCGQWGWELRTSEGLPGVWRNPGDGFDTGCIDWTPVTECYPQAESDGYLFEVRTR